MSTLITPSLPPFTPDDGYPTATSKLQRETEEALIQFLPTHPVHTGEETAAKKPKIPSTFLEKKAHMQFLVKNLVQGFGARYVSQDASQPWLLFWTLQAFSCLGVALDPGNKQRIISKVLTWQHPDGGFGGGPGQYSHLLTTYASVCTLAIAGSPERAGWDQIDRKGIYNFFMSLKQKDGSFLVAHHAEVDVRGIYCLLVVATLLDILTPELVEGTPEFIASCQTYEGGFASASHPSYDDTGLIPGAPRPPLGEAHGGYTFCALASWVILQPFIKSSAAAPSINLKSLTRWLVSMQGTASELGGFKGRTNKLVDGCYSWWCAGSFGLLEALGVGGLENAKTVPDEVVEQEGEWVDFDDGMFNSKALQEYILFAGQAPAGGLRDKPSKPADAYHTLYCLTGLSSAQHHIFPSGPMRRESLAGLLSWAEDPAYAKSFGHIVGGKDNRLNATHPITNLTVTHTEGHLKVGV
ncbi:farnesyltransferase subunit beta [Coprinopsis sp. MPI-PUGE-AT-0042]|nr:farnesyltransferase subunit beta [Coprinopsis sp. MPI-PUGE-AT-0042]